MKLSQGSAEIYLSAPPDIFNSFLEGKPLFFSALIDLGSYLIHATFQCQTQLFLLFQHLKPRKGINYKNEPSIASLILNY